MGTRMNQNLAGSYGCPLKQGGFLLRSFVRNARSDANELRVLPGSNPPEDYRGSTHLRDFPVRRQSEKNHESNAAVGPTRHVRASSGAGQPSCLFERAGLARLATNRA